MNRFRSAEVMTMIVGVAFVVVVGAQRPPAAPPAPTPLAFSSSFDGIAADQYHYVNNTVNDSRQPPGPQWNDATAGLPGDGFKESEGKVGYCGDPRGDGIIIAANRQGGSDSSTSRGFRHWATYHPDDNGIAHGVNAGGGNLVLSWVSPDMSPALGPLRELWFQWWQRWGPGIHPWSGTGSDKGTGNWVYTKDLDFNNFTGLTGRVTVGYGQGQSYHVGTYSPQRLLTADMKGGWGWRKAQGGERGSDQWIKYQVHLKADDGAKANGVAELWINGVQKVRVTNVNFSKSNPDWDGWRNVQISNNQSNVGSDSVLATSYTDYDDIKISVTGYITQD